MSVQPDQGVSMAACGMAGQACCAGDLCDKGLGCRSGACVAVMDDLGKSCMKDSECNTGLCVYSGSFKACSHPCVAPGDCLAGWLCDTVVDHAPPVHACLCVDVTLSDECNGLDDDCNGVIDDPVDADRDCAGRKGKGYTCNAGQCVCGGTRCGAICADITS